MPLWYSQIYNDTVFTYNIAMITAQDESDFELTKDTP